MSDDDNSILSKEIQDQISGLATVSQSPYFNSISKETCDGKEIEFINYNLVPDQTLFITVNQVLQHFTVSESGPSWREDLKQKNLLADKQTLQENGFKKYFQIIFHLLVGNHFNIILHAKNDRKASTKYIDYRIIWVMCSCIRWM